METMPKDGICPIGLENNLKRMTVDIGYWSDKDNTFAIDKAESLDGLMSFAIRGKVMSDLLGVVGFARITSGMVMCMSDNG